MPGREPSELPANYAVSCRKPLLHVPANNPNKTHWSTTFASNTIHSWPIISSLYGINRHLSKSTQNSITLVSWSSLFGVS